jgi:hypothetical protein
MDVRPCTTASVVSNFGGRGCQGMSVAVADMVRLVIVLVAVSIQPGCRGRQESDRAKDEPEIWEAVLAHRTWGGRTQLVLSETLRIPEKRLASVVEAALHAGEQITRATGMDVKAIEQLLSRLLEVNATPTRALEAIGLGKGCGRTAQLERGHLALTARRHATMRDGVCRKLLW